MYDDSDLRHEKLLQGHVQGVPHFSACILVQKSLVLMALLLGYFLLNLQVRFHSFPETVDRDISSGRLNFVHDTREPLDAHRMQACVVFVSQTWHGPCIQS